MSSGSIDAFIDLPSYPPAFWAMEAVENKMLLNTGPYFSSYLSKWVENESALQQNHRIGKAAVDTIACRPTEFSDLHIFRH
jgi:hypothetical protein